MINFKPILPILFAFLVASQCRAQKDAKTFETEKKYCEFLKKKYDLPSDLVIYSSTEGKPIRDMGKFGMMLFVTDGRIATVDEVTERLKVQCAPKELITKVTQQVIVDSSGDKVDLSNFVFKNMLTGEKMDLSKEDKFAIYIFSQRFGKYGVMYFKERKEVEKLLGYKTFVLSIDGAYIDSIKDIDKTPIYVQ